MKINKIILALFLFVAIGNSTLKAQSSMSDFNFVQVPEFYSFLNEPNQYDLNKMAKFYLNKYGFNAYFANEVPNVKKCDGLYAEVLGRPGFIYTEITVLIKDCNGMELFRSATGKSKLKEFKKAYQEAMRNAFASFEELGVQQKDISEVANVTTTVVKNSKGQNELSTNKAAGSENLPGSKFSTYYKNGKPYMLRKTAQGYTLYQEVKGAENDLLQVGKVIVNGNKTTYENVMGEVYEAKFTPSKSLILVLPDGEEEYVSGEN